MGSEHRKSKEQHVQAAKAIAAGIPISTALKEAGWSENTANQGRKAIEQSKPLREALQAELRGKFKHFMDLGSSVSAVEQENIARGRLLQNAIEGTDAGVQSSKLLWQDKRVNQLVPENQVGVIMIHGGNVQAPENILEAEEVQLKQLEGE